MVEHYLDTVGSAVQSRPCLPDPLPKRSGGLISLLFGRVRDWVSRLCCTRELRQDHSAPRQGRRSRRSPVADAAFGVARDGGRRAAAAPRRQGGDRPLDRERLLLRLRHRAVRARGRRAHRGGDAQDRRREPAVRAARGLARRGDRAVPSRGEKYKVEIIESIPEGEEVSYFQHGDFIDLCRGPHVERTGDIKAFKLLSFAGAYWRGDERNPQLQRIYGTAFPRRRSSTSTWRARGGQARDHRKLGKRARSLLVRRLVGPGLVLWHPKGALRPPA